MTKTSSILTTEIQVALSFITTYCMYVLYMLMHRGFIFFELIIAIIISFLTIFICFIIGLPIRLNQKINHWWIAHFYIPIISIVLGFIFIVLSFLYTQETFYEFYENHIEKAQMPNPILLALGWFLVAFSLLHNYHLPKQLRDLINKKS
jgi:hypothetical protein